MMDPSHAQKFVEMLTLISSSAHAVNVHNGWWENEDAKWIQDMLGSYRFNPMDAERLGNIASNLEKRNDGELMVLMHSEVSEALEAVRHGNPPSDHIPEFSGTEEEMADVVIRIMDYSAKRGLRLGEAIIAKLHFNYNRGFRHGGKAC